jgi:hypothetical protein
VYFTRGLFKDAFNGSGCVLLKAVHLLSGTRFQQSGLVGKNITSGVGATTLPNVASIFILICLFPCYFE